MKKTRPLLESDIQAAIVQWLEIKGLFFFSVPNERNSNSYHMAKLKKMGLRAGVSDLVIMHDGIVLFLELKRKGGRMSQAQKQFRADVSHQKNAIYKCAYSFYEAIEMVEELI